MRRVWKVLLVAGLLAGCGGSSHPAANAADVAKVKQTITRALAAVAAGDGATACSLATPTGQATLQKLVGAASCQAAVATLAAQLPANMKAALRDAKVKKVSISGNTANVNNNDITAPQATIGDLPLPPTVLVKQPDGSWKLNS
jgi:ketosteroid isomerase-like protein